VRWRKRVKGRKLKIIFINYEMGKKGFRVESGEWMAEPSAAETNGWRSRPWSRVRGAEASA
jgi:hypothetical protein